MVGGGNADYFFNNDLHFEGDLNRVLEMIKKETGKVFPLLKNIPFEYIWDGILGVTFDEYEAVGVTGANKNIYYALAYNGHGINLSFMFGRVIADLFRGHKHGWQETSYANYPLRKTIPPEPLKRLGTRGFLKYYQWLDG